MLYLTSLGLSFLAAISPGPNLLLVMSRALANGKRAGILSAFGVITGVIIWFLVLFFGFAPLLKIDIISSIFQSIAIMYLSYLAYMIIKVDINEDEKLDKNISYFRESFIATILNPEIAIFYGSIITNVIAQQEGLTSYMIALYSISFVAIESFVFFSSAIFVISVRKFLFRYILPIKIITSSMIIYYVFTMFSRLIG